MFVALDYFLYALPGLIVTIWAQSRIWRAYAEGSRIRASLGLSGAEAAIAVMRAGGVGSVAIEPVRGELRDHYDPAGKVLRLSLTVYEGRSLAAVGIAAHEAGHAIQDATHYPWLFVRNLIVPVARLGSTVCWLFVLAGILVGVSKLVFGGIILFSLAVVLQVINLPVEFNASRRGRAMLRSTGVISAEEDEVVGRVLSAAVWTYVACALTGVLTLFFYVGEIGAIKRRRPD